MLGTVYGEPLCQATALRMKDAEQSKPELLSAMRPELKRDSDCLTLCQWLPCVYEHIACRPIARHDGSPIMSIYDGFIICSTACPNHANCNIPHTTTHGFIIKETRLFTPPLHELAGWLANRFMVCYWN